MLKCRQHVPCRPAPHADPPHRLPNKGARPPCPAGKGGLMPVPLTPSSQALLLRHPELLLQDAALIEAKLAGLQVGGWAAGGQQLPGCAHHATPAHHAACSAVRGAGMWRAGRACSVWWHLGLISSRRSLVLPRPHRVL